MLKSYLACFPSRSRSWNMGLHSQEQEWGPETVNQWREEGAITEWWVRTVPTGTHMTAAAPWETIRDVSELAAWGPQEDICVPWLSRSPGWWWSHWVVMSLRCAFAHVRVEIRLLHRKGGNQDRPCPTRLHRTVHVSHGMSQRRGPGDEMQCPGSVWCRRSIETAYP